MKRIVIVDYGLGNLRSVSRGLEKSGATPRITSDISEISAADGIVLPGVGAFRDGMEQLSAMRKAIIEAASSVPVLGICLGMQMLLEWSEEHGASHELPDIKSPIWAGTRSTSQCLTIPLWLVYRKDRLSILFIPTMLMWTRYTR